MKGILKMDDRENIRDPRFLKAVQDVGLNYKILKIVDDGIHMKFHVSRKTDVSYRQRDPYLVSIRIDWSENPSCTCPDSMHRLSVKGFCKHVIGVMMGEPALKHQLIDLFLPE